MRVRVLHDMNSIHYSTQKYDWQTPPEVFDPLHEEFNFTVDACATPDNALLQRYWTPEDDALAQDWSGERIWCNPPYGKFQRPFIEKAAERRAQVAVFLLPARTDTRAWHDWIFPYASDVRFVKGRIQFVGAPYPAPFPSAIVIWRGIV